MLELLMHKINNQVKVSVHRMIYLFILLALKMLSIPSKYVCA